MTKIKGVDNGRFTRDYVEALFLLAGIEVFSMHELKNGYDPERTNDPWWLVHTPFGLVKIGWRKRVISINWEDSRLQIVITEDEVTKNEEMVHAWSYPKALEYLNALRKHAERTAANEEA